MRAFPRLAAVDFRRELGSGTTKPCVFGCVPFESMSLLEGDQIDLTEFVVKLRADVRGQATGLLNEYVAAQLALILRLPMPEPALVVLEPELATSLRAVGRTDIAARVQRSVGLNFGTRNLTPGYSTWVIDAPVPERMRQAALEIFAFDALVENVDRRRDNPNLLARGDHEVLIYDHELAFGFVSTVGLASLGTGRLDFMRNHPFYEDLRGREDLDLQSFERRLDSLDDGEIDGICDSVPTAFGSTGLKKIGEHLRACRTNAKAFVLSVKGVLR